MIKLKTIMTKMNLTIPTTTVKSFTSFTLLDSSNLELLYCNQALTVKCILYIPNSL